MNVFSVIFLVFASIVLPVTTGIVFSVRSKNIKPLFLGAGCFLIFQILTRIPIIQYILPLNPQYQLFQITNPLLFIFFISLSAGVFEELGRYILMKSFLKNGTVRDSISFGIGHGGIEAVLLVGVQSIILVFTNSITALPSEQLFLSGIERISAMMLHIGWSVLIWQSVKNKKFRITLFAIATHTLVDFISVYLKQLGFSLYFIEGLFIIFAVIMLVYVRITVKRL